MQDSIYVEDYCPVPEVVTPVHEVAWPKFDVIDGHNHIPVAGPRAQPVDVPAIVDTLDAVRVKTIVNLTGRGDATSSAAWRSGRGASWALLHLLQRALGRGRRRLGR